MEAVGLNARGAKAKHKSSSSRRLALFKISPRSAQGRAARARGRADGVNTALAGHLAPSRGARSAPVHPPAWPSSEND